LRGLGLRTAAGIVALAVAALAGADNPADDLEDLRSRIQRLQQQLAESEESKSDAADALRESERAISQTNRRLFELAAEQRSVRNQIGRLQARQAELAASVNAQQELLANQLYQQYLRGHSEPLRLLLSLQDPGELARRVHYLSYVHRARTERIAGLRADLAELEDVSARTRARERDLERVQADQARQRAQLARERREHQAVLLKVSREVTRQRREIGTLKRDEERLRRLVQRLAQELAPRTRAPARREAPRLRNERLPEGGPSGPFRQLKGSLRLPVRGELANRFGSLRKDGGLPWKGLLIRAPAGEEVRAIAQGRVVFADWLRGFGNLLILDHGDGYLSLYAYNEALLKEVGDGVAGGEPIGAVGSSGGSAETGLYFEIRYQGQPIDPLTWVALK
jgi:septal ring factor EnvC (AmiA/AmiB activator)